MSKRLPYFHNGQFGSNTHIYYTFDGLQADVTVYGNCIATLTADKITFNLQGYTTPLTRRRMNRVAELFGMPITVTMRKGATFCRVFETWYPFENDTCCIKITPEMRAMQLLRGSGKCQP